MLKTYKGYTGSIEFSVEDNCFHGHVLGIRSIISYEADQFPNLEKEFQESVDCYLEWCEEDGIEPEKPKSGKIALRLQPKIHENVAVAATLDAKSINQWISDVIEKAAEERLLNKSIKIRVK